MTTIVYDHKAKVVAYDSRISANGLVLTDEHDKKIESYKHEAVFFMSGDECDIPDFIEGYKPGGEALRDFNCVALVSVEGAVYLACVSDLEYKVSKLTYSHAIGSGDYHALSALDFGTSAIEAVEHAASRDVWTGGQVRLFDLGG